MAGSVGEFGSLLLLTILFSAQPEPTIVQILYVLALGLAAVVGAVVIRWFWQTPWMRRVLLGSDDSTSQLRVRGGFVILLIFSALAFEFGVDALLGAFVGGIVLSIADRDDRPNLERFQGKLRAIGYGFLVPVFFIVTGITFDARSLLASSSSLALLPVLVLAILLVRAAPALIYRRRVGLAPAAAAGLLQATTLTFPVVVAQVGLALHLLARPTAAALIGAALLSVLLFPAIALALRPWTRAVPGGPAPDGPEPGGAAASGQAAAGRPRRPARPAAGGAGPGGSAPPAARRCRGGTGSYRAGRSRRSGPGSRRPRVSAAPVERLSQLLHRARPDDHRGHGRMREREGHRELRQRAARCRPPARPARSTASYLAAIARRGPGRTGLGCSAARPEVRSTGWPLRYRPDRNPAGQRAPGQHAHAVALAGGQDAGLDAARRASSTAAARSGTAAARAARRPGGPRRSRSAGNVEQPNARILPWLHQVGQRATASPRCRCPGRAGAPGTGRSSPSAAAAGCARSSVRIQRRELPRPVAALAHREMHLGGQHDVVAPAPQRLAR